jgi:hypothetical protein
MSFIADLIGDQIKIASCIIDDALHEEARPHPGSSLDSLCD